MVPELKNILDTYKTKGNKELSTVAVHLYNDFTALKDSMLILNTNLMEIEKVYTAVYQELQHRLKFENEQPKSE
jgi:hypothetical protein